MTLGYGSFRVHGWHGGIAPYHPWYRLDTWDVQGLWFDTSSLLKLQDFIKPDKGTRK